MRAARKRHIEFFFVSGVDWAVNVKLTVDPFQAELLDGVYGIADALQLLYAAEDTEPIPRPVIPRLRELNPVQILEVRQEPGVRNAELLKPPNKLA